ncbi:MAG: hypothetical protein K2M95_03680 [Clostridiales bacterium]|nr:hypothetical protein [Clostridiales bacterium]
MYTYGDLSDDICFLHRFGIETGRVGISAFGRLIPYVRLGTARDTVLITAGIHAREAVSSLFAIKQLYRAANEKLPCSLVFVPMVNPDGNVLVSEGAKAFGSMGEKLLAVNGGNPDFSLWKASATGVDLNVNFDAEWGKGAQNVFTPSPANYVGPHAASEPETQALCAFTEKIKPVLTLSYHAKGREIYFEFGQSGDTYERDKKIADKACAYTGYTRIDGTRGSAGGYKDWCILHLGIPSLTVELCDDRLRHPLSDNAITEDFDRAPLLPIVLYEYMRTL